MTFIKISRREIEEKIQMNVLVFDEVDKKITFFLSTNNSLIINKDLSLHKKWVHL